MRLAIAQEDFVVTLENDSIKGKVGFTRRSYYDEVEVRNDDGKQTFKAYQIISADKDGTKYFPITYKNRRTIGKVVTKGGLSHYLVMAEGINGFGNAILVREDGAVLQVSNIGFKKRLIEFLRSCPIVAEKIENKEIPASDLDTILPLYNSECSNIPPAQEVADIQKTAESNQLSDFAQLIIDIQSKIDAGEKVPSYMIDALKSTDSSAIQEDLQALIKKLESQ